VAAAVVTMKSVMNDQNCEHDDDGEDKMMGPGVRE